MKKTLTRIAAALLGLTTIGCQNLEEEKLAALAKLGTAAVRLAVDLAESTRDVPPAEVSVESITPERVEVQIVKLDRAKVNELRAIAAHAKGEARFARFRYKIEVCPKRAS